MRGVLSALKAAADASATMDVLHAGTLGPQSSDSWGSGAGAQRQTGFLASIQLDNCGDTAGLLIPLLASPQRHQQEAGLDALSLLLASFAEVSKDSSSVPGRRYSLAKHCKQVKDEGSGA